MSDPKVIAATIRDADDELHIECRFSDGQKFAAVTVAAEFEDLARSICEFLNRDGKPAMPDLIERAKVMERITYLVNLADWCAGQGLCQIEGLQDPDEWCCDLWNELRPGSNGGDYSAEALAAALICELITELRKNQGDTLGRA